MAYSCGCLSAVCKLCMSEACVFVQFSDMLVYTSRIATSSLQFKVHGQLSLKGMAVRLL